MRVITGLIVLLGLFACSSTQISTISDTAQNMTQTQKTGLSGWNELTITTQNPEPWITFFTEIAGWEIRTRTEIDRGLHALWELPQTATGEEILFANKGAKSGFVRVVHLTGVEQNWIRADDRPWDTGAIFDFNVRVIDLYDVRKKMLAKGWQGDSEPIRYTFGPFEVIEWIARGPDGVRIALIERLKPELEGWPDLKSISRTFNSTQTVRDMTKAKAFYQDVLGMDIYLEHKGASSSPGANVLGLPHEAAATVDREIYILHPQGINEGSIEILSFDGATGIDLSDNSIAKNIGLSVLRFPVDDLAATIGALKARGLTQLSDPVEMELLPYGRVKVVQISSPEGARLEIYSLIH